MYDRFFRPCIIIHMYQVSIKPQSVLVQHGFNTTEVRRSVIGMQSFKDTPHIHLIIPLSAVISSRTLSFTTGQVSLPYKSIFLTQILKTFPLSFVWITLLLSIGSYSLNTFHKEKIHVETASKQPPHWPIESPRYLKVDSTWKLSFPMLASFVDAITAGTISPEHL